MKAREKSLAKEIRNYYFLLLVVSVVLTALFLLVVVTKGFEASIKDSIRGEAKLISSLIDSNNLNVGSIATEIPKKDSGKTSRITIIDNNGTVIYDNKADISTLDNHSDREEVIGAINSGEYATMRYSNTLGIKYYYHAIKLQENQGVLRVSISSDTPQKLLLDRWWQLGIIFIAILIICNYLSIKLANQIIKPLDNLNLDNLSSSEVYTELSPFIKKINQQKAKIDSQISQLEHRATTTETITNNMSEGIMMLDKDSNVVSINNSFRAIIGSGLSYNLPRKLVYLTRNIDIIHALEAILDGNRYQNIIKLKGRYYQLIGSSIPEGGGILLISDVTELERSAIKRREFSANVSHELRTPLTSISGYGELLKMGIVSESDTAKFGEKIHFEAQRMVKMIENIMKLSEIDNIQQEDSKNFSSVELLSLSVEVANRLESLAAGKDIKLSVSGDKASVLGDASMLENLIFNITENAIKYTNNGGEVFVRVGVKDGKNFIAVKDTGVGIPAKDIPHIFERFYRADKDRSSKTGGNGIGLALVKHIAEYHGGNITVESKVGEGSTFTVRF